MLITQTPLRISFCGGGTDLAAFYKKAGHGTVVSTAIDRFVYLAIHRFFHPKFLLKYSRTETTDTVPEIQHPLIRECLLLSELTRHVELTSFADIPSEGSGLGSSSAFCVGLLLAASAFQGKSITPAELAAQACEVEIERLHEPIGKQDQYASAFGGLNRIRFHADESVECEPLPIPAQTLQILSSHLHLYFTGVTRKASSILSEQRARTESDEATFRSLLTMRDLAETLANELLSGHAEALGEILHESWLLKKSLATGVSSSELDEMYQKARSAGALGGKILGAGGGGFFLLYCDPEKRNELDRALGLKRIPFGLEKSGAKIVFRQTDNEAAL